MKIVFEGWDPVDKQPVRGTLEGVDRAQTQAADMVTVQLQHGEAVVLKQNPTALTGTNIRVGACAWDGAYVLSAYLDAQPSGTFAGLRCVELGAGMRLVGLVLARLGAAVYLTDKPQMTVHGRVNAAKNKLLAAAGPTPAAARAVVGQAPAAAAGAVVGQAPAAAAGAVVGQAPAAAAEAAAAPGSVTVVGLDWEDAASIAAATSSITSQGPIDLIVGTDCIYPDPDGTIPSSSGFMAALNALAVPGKTRVLVTFETRSDALREALLHAAASVEGGCSVVRLDEQQLPKTYRCKHIEVYELKLG